VQRASGHHGAVSRAAAVDQRGPWATEIVDVVRAASGGLLFGVPLLYTMEVWWTGHHTRPWQVLVVLGVTFVPVLLLNRTAGFRKRRATTLGDAVIESVESVGIGIVLVTIVLVLLREITAATPMHVALGKIAYESMPFCIGIGVAHHFLGRSRDETDDEANDDVAADDGGLNATLADLGATALGAVFVALSIAPTDEVPMVAAALDPPWLLAMIGASLVISYAIVFVAGFSGEQQRHAQIGVLQRPSSETVASYLVSLAVAGAMLWFFQRASGPWPVTLAEVIVLGLPAAVGGAAGRLAV
jgi:putative integral membrane protein (TIGR02587 family)